jgi:hypothetical protein
MNSLTELLLLFFTGETKLWAPRAQLVVALSRSWRSRLAAMHSSWIIMGEGRMVVATFATLLIIEPLLTRIELSPSRTY